MGLYVFVALRFLLEGVLTARDSAREGALARVAPQVVLHVTVLFELFPATLEGADSDLVEAEGGLVQDLLLIVPVVVVNDLLRLGTHSLAAAKDTLGLFGLLNYIIHISSLGFHLGRTGCFDAALDLLANCCENKVLVEPLAAFVLQRAGKDMLAESGYLCRWRFESGSSNLALVIMETYQGREHRRMVLSDSRGSGHRPEHGRRCAWLKGLLQKHGAPVGMDTSLHFVTLSIYYLAALIEP